MRKVIKLDKILYLILLSLILVGYTTIDDGKNEIIDYKNYDVCLYRNDTLYIINNDIGNLVNTIWECDSDSITEKPIIVLVDQLPK